MSISNKTTKAAAAAAAVLVFCVLVATATGNIGVGVAGVVLAAGILVIPTLSTKEQDTAAPRPAQPVGVTADGRPVYALVGRTPDGSPVYANEIVPGSAPAPQSGRTNTMAVLALVFGLIIGILGIVFGHIALAQIDRTGERGKGMATAGLVLGYLWLAVVALFYLARA
ncbi:hypothetical protein SCMU_39370 [Sinomonas cyclohexanicum]|uniref:DUF4190 domain-containing protein n=1 Tax=Sinomonas cyclohexanicum TaxID=322009 RepID=A0ABM7Q0K0_SINCY|nr:DUF4190 domain-containing protein [Corynebacterium cyclohexanicum]BCT78095.1 hypothetical protein SCMU_39370 [Corynebacterium cyclohexanicum]